MFLQNSNIMLIFAEQLEKDSKKNIYTLIYKKHYEDY